jgi:hypothetical protein
VRVLAIDPSSTCTGFAVLTGLGPADLVEVGLIRPSLSKAAQAAAEPGEVVRAWNSRKELTALRRVLSVVRDVEEVVAEVAAGGELSVVVEIPSGLTGTGAKKGARGSLTTYGLAAGMVYQAARAALPGQVFGVTERQWTAGAGSKEKRARSVVGLYAGRYRVADDEGLDGADAIGLGRWWVRGVMEGRVIAPAGFRAR